MTPLDELRQALATIDRQSAETPSAPWTALGSGRAGGDHWYIVSENESILSVAANDGDNEDVREPTARIVVSAVAVYRGVVRDIIADAIERYPTQEKYGETGYAYEALRIARDINSRTEGTGK